MKIISEGLAAPWLALYYPFVLTKRNACHKEIITLMMNDLLKGKSFNEIGRNISSFRSVEYMDARAKWAAIKNCLESSPRINFDGKPIDLPDFGAMDEFEAYNQQLQPTVDYLIDLFCNYYHTVKNDVEASIKNVAVGLVQSIDCTFNYMERAKVRNVETGTFI